MQVPLTCELIMVRHHLISISKYFYEKDFLVS